MAAIYTIELYRLDIANAVFNRIDIIDTYENLQFVNKINDIGKCTFDLNFYHPKATATNLIRFSNHVAVKRNGTVVWFGPISTLSGKFNDLDGQHTIEASTYLYHFMTRNTAANVIYSASTTPLIQDQTDIVWDVINYSQGLTNGNLLITRGSHPTSTNRQITYQYKNIAEAIRQMADNINGYEFDFTPTVDSNGKVTGIVFNMYYPQVGQYRNDLPPLKIDDNIQSLEYMTDGNIYNYTFLKGTGTGDGVVTGTAQSADSMLGYTRREYVAAEPDIVEQTTLQNKATAYNNISSVEYYKIAVTLLGDKKPSYGDYILGDILNLDTSVAGTGGFTSWIKQARVTELAVSVDENGMERVQPKLSIIQ